MLGSAPGSASGSASGSAPQSPLGSALTPPLGIIMLDTAFERPPGDVGNRASWPFPVLLRTVPAATARRIVGGRDDDLLAAFVRAGEALHAGGACALITSCGFLVAHQAALAAALPLPIATSSLLQLPSLLRLLRPGAQVGVITYDAAALGPRHWAASGTAPQPTAGLPPQGRFHGLIERSEPYDGQALEAELIETVAGLLGRAPELGAPGLGAPRLGAPGLGALVFECTNLSPFSAAIARRFRLPVFDILTLGRWLHASVCAAQH